MSWFSVLKGWKELTPTRHFLLEVFNIPRDVPLNISTNFMQRFYLPKNEDVITERRFEILMQYSRAGLYQEIIDKMNEWFDEKQGIYLNEQRRNMSPEKREERRIKSREYEQRPEVKERRKQQRARRGGR